VRWAKRSDVDDGFVDPPFSGIALGQDAVSPATLPLYIPRTLCTTYLVLFSTHNSGAASLLSLANGSLCPSPFFFAHDGTLKLMTDSRFCGGNEAFLSAGLHDVNEVEERERLIRNL
jgi:hypothetical protein